MAQFVPAGCGVPFDNFDNLKNISRMTWHLGRAQITKAVPRDPALHCQDRIIIQHLVFSSSEKFADSIMFC